MWTCFSNAGPVTDYTEAAQSDTAAFGRFHQAMLENGVLASRRPSLKLLF